MWPLLGIAAGTLAPAASTLHGVVNAFVDVATLPTKYDMSYKNAYLLPSPSDMLDSWINGFTDELERNWVMAHQGIPIGLDPEPGLMTTAKKAWENVVKSRYPKLPLDQIIIAYYSGIIDKDTFNKLTKHYGFIKDQIPVLNSILEPKFDAGIIFNRYLRGYKNEENTIQAIRKYYGCSKKDADQILELTNVLPPVQDLIRFAVRDVYNPDAIARLHLDDEFEQNKDLSLWAGASGLGYATIIDDQGNEITRDIVRDYWRAHWVLPAPTQTYQFLHRVRASRIPILQQQVPGVTPFTSDDLDYYLRSNDYTPPVRKWLAAISFNVLGMRDTRRAFTANIINEDEQKEQLRDQGYNEHDVQILTDLNKDIKKKQNDAENEKKFKQRYGNYWMQMLSAYEDGSVTRENAYSALVSTGMDTDEAEGRLMAIDVKVNRKTVKLYIDQTRAEYFLGGMDGITAYEILVQGGVAQLRANNLVQQWARQQTRKRKTGNTAQLLKWFASGYITVENLRDRLNILGWQGTDVIVLLAQANDDRAALIASAQAKQARSDRQQAMDIKRLIDEQKKNAAQAIARAMRQAPITTMKRWFKENIITEQEAADMLRYYQFSEENIIRTLEDFIIGKGAPANG